MEQLKPALPDFALRVSAGPDNILNSLLKSRKIAFDALNAEGANCDSLPVSIRLRTEGLAYGNVVLDTVTADIRQNGKRLEYALGWRTPPGTSTTSPGPDCTATSCGTPGRRTSTSATAPAAKDSASGWT